MKHVELPYSDLKRSNGRPHETKFRPFGALSGVAAPEDASWRLLLKGLNNQLST